MRRTANLLRSLSGRKSSPQSWRRRGKCQSKNYGRRSVDSKKDARVCNPGNPYNLLLKDRYREVLLKFKNRYN